MLAEMKHRKSQTYSFAKVLCKSRNLCDNFCKAKPLSHEAVGIYALTGFSVPSFPNTLSPAFALHIVLVIPVHLLYKKPARPWDRVSAVSSPPSYGEFEANWLW